MNFRQQRVNSTLCQWIQPTHRAIKLHRLCLKELDRTCDVAVDYPCLSRMHKRDRVKDNMYTTDEQLMGYVTSFPYKWVTPSIAKCGQMQALEPFW